LLQLGDSTIEQHNGLNKSKVPAEMVTKVLCVAEKPSIAKAVAGHLSGGSHRVVSFTHSATYNSRILTDSRCSPTHARHISRITAFPTTFLLGVPVKLS